MKKSRSLIVFGALTAAMTLFIFSNSLRGSVDSHAMSNSLIDLLMPLLSAVEKAFGEINWVLVIRKGAHLTEFCILGILVWNFMLAIRHSCGKNLFGYGLFYVLAVAVTDEFIQSFSDRTSAVSDVLIDFTGALLGIGLVSLVVFLKKQKCK